MPCPPPVDLHSTQRARRPSAAFPETPTCYRRGMLRPFLLHHAHPLTSAFTVRLSFVLLHALHLAQFKGRGKGGEVKSTGCQPWFTFSDTLCSDLQCTGLSIHQPCSEERFSPYRFGDFQGMFGSCSANHFVVDSLRGMMRRCWELGCLYPPSYILPKWQKQRRRICNHTALLYSTGIAISYTKKWSRGYCLPGSSSIHRILMNSR